MREAAPWRKASRKTIKAPGKKPVTFQPGGQSPGVPQGKQIPAGKMRDALAGKAGPKAAAQVRFAVNVLGAKRPSGAKNGASRSK